MTDEMDLKFLPGGKFSTKRVIPSDPAQARDVQEEIEQALRGHCYNDREIFSIKLAVEEALVNAIKHGNQLDPAKEVHIGYNITPERFEVIISDEGAGFDPREVPDPTAVENLERPSGRGLMLMKHYMTLVNYSETGNTVYMYKLRNGAKST
jgi:serine/threonine-protein kinase RsbW